MYIYFTAHVLWYYTVKYRDAGGFIKEARLREEAGRRWPQCVYNDWCHRLRARADIRARSRHGVAFPTGNLSSVDNLEQSSNGHFQILEPECTVTIAIGSKG